MSFLNILKVLKQDKAIKLSYFHKKILQLKMSKFKKSNNQISKQLLIRYNVKKKIDLLDFSIFRIFDVLE